MNITHLLVQRRGKTTQVKLFEEDLILVLLPDYGIDLLHKYGLPLISPHSL
jgi:hypothetical protein